MKKRVILIGSKIGQDAIKQSLGKPEYSYYFLLKEFLPVLHHLAQVIEVKSTSEVDALFSEYSNNGHDVVFLSVSPPQQTPLNLQCPTICLFAWEFDSLPDQEWGGDKRNNWYYVFSRIAGAIATSEEAVQLVKKLMGQNYPVVSAPAPIWDRYSRLFAVHRPTLEERVFKFDGVVFDSHKLGLSVDGLVPKAPVARAEREESETLADIPAAPVPVSVRRIGVKQWLAEKKQGSIQLLKQWAHEAVTPFKRKKLQELKISGVIYSTVLNPADGRKNWIDIIT
ncbi:MAG TPA: glycosyltransferase family 1 protein, partial [Pseudomonadales bacterium]|nr:glycosyltransferase family 1 protein [Pseudomonadales bacterium]